MMLLSTDTFSPGNAGRILPLFSLGATIIVRTRNRMSPCLAWAGPVISAPVMALASKKVFMRIIVSVPDVVVNNGL